MTPQSASTRSHERRSKIRWLSVQDKEWLHSHLPPSRNGAEVSRRVDWESRDARLAEAIGPAALRIFDFCYAAELTNFSAALAFPFLMFVFKGLLIDT